MSKTPTSTRKNLERWNSPIPMPWLRLYGAKSSPSAGESGRGSAKRGLSALPLTISPSSVVSSSSGRVAIAVEFLKQVVGAEEWASFTGSSHIVDAATLHCYIADGKLLCRAVGMKDLCLPPGKRLQIFVKRCYELGISKDNLFDPDNIFSVSKEEAAEKLLKALIALVQTTRFLERSQQSTPRDIPSSASSTKYNLRSRVRDPAARCPPALKSKYLQTAKTCAERRATPRGFTKLQATSTPSPQGRDVVETPVTKDDAKGLLGILPSTTPKGTPSTRRVSMNTLQAHASLANVHERIADSLKSRNESLTKENEALMGDVQQLQERIKDIDAARQAETQEAGILKAKLEEMKQELSIAKEAQGSGKVHAELTQMQLEEAQGQLRKIQEEGLLTTREEKMHLRSYKTQKRSLRMRFRLLRRKSAL